jgi:2-amino-4-hydroxy-6-hydroxymethyldihydropteridine diphosphokinase
VTVIVVAFGSNLGDRHTAIRDASGKVAALLTSFRLSSIIETAPVGTGLQNDPPYLNAVAVGESSLAPRELFEKLRAIEAEAGRTRSHQGAPRTLDLDLILVGDQVVDDPDLQIPHPRFRERRFVLEPLAELEPDLRDPVTGLTIHALLNNLPVL